MAYEYISLITDGVLVQGDSSDITMFNTSLANDLSTGWSARYTISVKRGDTPLVLRDLPLNDGTEGETPNTFFVHQILPAESAILTPGTKYDVSIQVTNTSLNYNAEIAQFKLKILPQGVN